MLLAFKTLKTECKNVFICQEVSASFLLQTAQLLMSQFQKIEGTIKCVWQMPPCRLYQPFFFLSVCWGQEIYFCNGTTISHLSGYVISRVWCDWNWGFHSTWLCTINSGCNKWTLTWQTVSWTLVVITPKQDVCHQWIAVKACGLFEIETFKAQNVYTRILG